ncbi:uncharacterized protein [Haliotis cracherodii]|uniref:uncharacterized protein n=1 Tax=Haliotis cracherodii TaxID=6455 RepID=UPI0039EB5AB3
MQQFRRATYAETTKRTYSSMKTAYLRFCLYFSRTPVPADRMTVLLYRVFLTRSPSATSIPGYMNIIRLLHLEVGLPNPLETWEQKALHKGILRLKGTPTKQKLPITPDILRRMHSHMDMSEPFLVAFWAACIIAFFCFLRKSTMLPETRGSGSRKQTYLSLHDAKISPDKDSAMITVRHTKTIQFGQRVLKLPLARVPDSVLCPVKALEHLLSQYSEELQHSNAPLFSYVDRSGVLKSLTYKSFVKTLKYYLDKCGYDSGAYSGHSFRRGGCSYAFDIGIPPLLIKLRGDWRSNAYERYVTVYDAMHEKLAQSLSAGIVN